MKKCLLLITIFNGICLSILAQTFYIEPRVAIGGTQFTIKEKASDGSNSSFKYGKTTVNTGVLLLYRTRTNVEFGFGVQYSLEGGRRSYNLRNKNLSMAEDVDLSYIRIPVRVSWVSKEVKNLAAKLSIGPSFGILTGGKTDIEYRSEGVIFGPDPIVPPPMTQDAEDYWKKFDLSIAVSAAAAYKISNRVSLVIEGTLLRGLTDNRREDKKNIDGYPKGHNFKSNNNTFNVGLNFSL